jgi:8-amino-7-oxononanoate synthase
VKRFPYRDARKLAQEVKHLNKARTLVMTDGLFAQQGEMAPVREYLEVLPESATLLVDDAHGVGVVGNRGRGVIELPGAARRRIVLTATLSKAFGCYGGMILGSTRLQRRVQERSRILAGNTPVPPPCATAALAAIKVMRREGGERRARLARHVTPLKAAVRAVGGPIPDAPGPMFSLAPRDASAVRRLRQMLLAAGIYPCHIRYPNGPAPSYFRFALSSEHTAQQVDALRGVLSEFYASLKA